MWNVEGLNNDSITQLTRSTRKLPHRSTIWPNSRQENTIRRPTTTMNFMSRVGVHRPAHRVPEASTKRRTTKLYAQNKTTQLHFGFIHFVVNYIVFSPLLFVELFARRRVCSLGNYAIETMPIASSVRAFRGICNGLHEIYRNPHQIKAEASDGVAKR